MTRIRAALTAAICPLCFWQAVCAAPDSSAHTPEQAVLATYQKMEEADRKGDGELWLSLRGRATLGTMNDGLKETIRKGGHARPSVRYEPLAARALGARSGVLGKVTDPESNSVQYDAVLFVLEDGAWKVDREQWSEKPFDSFVLFAMLQPVDGAFLRDGAPWKAVPYASNNPDVVHKEDVVWRVQATFDESFFYIRFESTQALPAAGSKLRPNVAKTGGTGGPAAPPAMQIKSSRSSLYEISVSSLISTAPVMDAKGKPSGERYSVGYKLSVKKSEGDEVFATTIGETTHSFLLAVTDRSIDIRIPLDALGSDGDAKTGVFDLEETDPVNRVLPYHVQPYKRQ
jgi:hypothetical protein